MDQPQGRCTVNVVFRVFILAIYLFLMAPLLFVFISSVGDQAMFAFPPTSLSLRWYSEISPALIDALKTSVLAAGATTALSTAVGIWMALAIARSRTAFAEFLRTISVAPLAVPHLAIGIALYHASLLLWDFSGITLAETFYGLVLGHSVIALPYVVRGVLVGHEHFDVALEEAALNLGASRWRVFCTVTVPAVIPGLISGAFLAFLASFDDVTVALFMGGGKYATTLPLQVLASVEFSLKPDIMAISTLIIVTSMVLLLVLDRFLGLERFFGAPK